MPARIDHAQNSSYRRRTDSLDRGASAVATIWLVFYGLALGVIITSSLAPGAIELANMISLSGMKLPHTCLLKYRT
jgi:hypothetical protein